MKYTVLDMSAHINGGVSSFDGSEIKALTGINIAWKVVRDLLNIAFIFLLVYEGIKMIIGQSNKDGVKEFISMIVLASLLVNFSLFFTKVLIDASNIVTIGVYDSIIDKKAKEVVPGSGLGSAPEGRYVSGLAVPFMTALGLQTIYDANGLQGDSQSKTIIFLMGSVLFVIVAFAFFAVAIMFIIRYITLILLLMLSPIAYMGMALPQLKKYSSDWWASLNGQLLFAPIYMIMTMIVITLITSPGFVTKGSFTSLTTTTIAESIGLLLNFAVIIGLAIASLVISKSTSTQGSKFIGQATGKLTAFAGGAVMGTTAWAGRRTVGAAASRLAEQKQFQDWAGRSALGERALKMARGTAAGSFDVRASRAGQKTTDTLGVDFGKAQQGGFDKTLADKTARKEKFGQSLRGDQAKRDYAIRQASGIGILGGIGVRGGSGPNERVRTLAGTMGRSNRIVASRTLSAQLTGATTARDNARNRLDQLNDQETRMLNELSTINAAITAGTVTTQQTARQGILNGPVTDRRSLAYVQNEINVHQTAILPPLDNDVTNLRNDINRLGITNPNDVVLTPVQQQQNALATAAGLTPPHVGRDRRADEQNY
jgi:hypothetical protein